MSTTDATIWVRFQKEGTHKYPAALTDPKLKEVSFLGHPHRHMFHFEVELEVFHDDRDVEFIMFKRELEGLFDSGAMDIDFQSCEMLAREILQYIIATYRKRNVRVSVSEDNENGATLDYKYQNDNINPITGLPI